MGKNDASIFDNPRHKTHYLRCIFCWSWIKINMTMFVVCTHCRTPCSTTAAHMLLIIAVDYKITNVIAVPHLAERIQKQVVTSLQGKLKVVFCQFLISASIFAHSSSWCGHMLLWVLSYYSQCEVTHYTVFSWVPSTHGHFQIYVRISLFRANWTRLLTYILLLIHVSANYNRHSQGDCWQ